MAFSDWNVTSNFVVDSTNPSPVSGGQHIHTNPSLTQSALNSNGKQTPSRNQFMSCYFRISENARSGSVLFMSHRFRVNSGATNYYEVRFGLRGGGSFDDNITVQVYKNDNSSNSQVATSGFFKLPYNYQPTPFAGGPNTGVGWVYAESRCFESSPGFVTVEVKMGDQLGVPTSLINILSYTAAVPAELQTEGDWELRLWGNSPPIRTRIDDLVIGEVTVP